MKYKVSFKKPKKKKGYFSHQEATFYDIDSAIFYEKKMTELGCFEFQITPV